MKIHIREDPSFNETEITINCNAINQDVEKIISLLRVMDLKLTGEKGNQTYIINASQVLYIDTVDKKTFFYTKSDVYETHLNLYELEERLSALDFFRANKSCIINFNQISSIKADIDGRLLLTMSNQERLIVSRQYALTVKTKLGVK